MPPILFLIDGHALAYRMYFALTRGSGGGRWVTSSGEPTAGIYGFTSVLLRILEQEDPDYLAVAFDTGKTFRDEIFPDYKGTREKMPEDLRPQIERIKQLVDVFNIPRLEMDGYEADDVLGSVARQAVIEGLGVKIFTGDRDLLQLVDDRVIVNLPGRSLADAKDYYPSDVEAYMGVRPDQIVDYKALVGDSSDNIPGVSGVGKKTTEALLRDYDTLDGIYEHLEELKPGIKKKLETDRENAYLSQKLAAIILDLQIPLDLEMARPDHYEPDKIQALFRELEFRSLIKRLDGLSQRYGKGATQSGEQLSLFGGPPKLQDSDSHSKIQSGSLKVQIVDTDASLQELVSRLKDADVIAFDTETTSTDQMEAELVGISLALQTGAGFYIPVGHQQGVQLGLEVVLEALRDPLMDPKIPKAGHNLKYDYVMLARYGLKVSPLSFDTMIAEWLINPASRNLGLKNLAWVRLDHRMTEIEELIGKGKNQISMADVPISDVAAYAADDAAIVLSLMPILQSEMESSGVFLLFQELEMPLVKVLAEMEMTGISLDTPFLDSMSDQLGSRLKEIEDLIHNAVGTTFNINSTQQLSKALFETLKLNPPVGTRKTASGFFSTAASVLETLRGVHPVVDWVLEHRELAKLKSTYVDALPNQVNPRTKRVHTSYNQAGSRTGRIASSNPNLQNIPIRTDLGRMVRHAFVASPGHLLLAVDYSQVELRIVAHMAQDEAMMAAFRAGKDIHATTASAIYGVELDEVSKAQRRHSKAINFGLIYGMSAFGLTRTTDLTLAESEDFVAAYFMQFPGVKGYLDGIRKLAAERGYVETLLGRRRYFPGLVNPSNQQIRMREEREAINAPIQGTAADIMKIAMLQVRDALSQSGLPVKILLQVHDELVLECPTEVLGETSALVQRVMENAYSLDVPLKTEARFGSNWGKLQLLISNTP
jgi:DNA polymerase-1